MTLTQTHASLDALATTALREVLAQQFRVAATAVAPGPAERATLGASVPLAGATLSGHVSVCVSPALARALVERLLGEACGSTEEAQDLCRELCNILAGGVAAALGQDGTLIELGTPSLLGADPDNGPATAPNLIHRSHWLCEHEPLTFGLDIRTTP